MKRLKFYRAVVAIAMMLIGWLPSLAHDFEVDGIFYNKINSCTVEVTYKGDTFFSYSNEYEGNVVIPSSVNYNGVTYSVTSIGNNAFDDCTSLTGIEIPNSVTSIGDEAFSGCERLTGIEIPNSVTSIGEWAFSGCSGLIDVVMGNSVTSIGEYAFNSCKGLTSIEIPNSVTSIGFGAFRYCSSLTSIEIPNSVTSIGSNAFYDCSSLTSAVIGNGVTSIGNEAFRYCSSLTSVEIGNSVTSIGRVAFWGCSSLTSIEIPNSVTSIGFGAFYDCSSLTSAVIGNGVTSIGDEAFRYCSSLTSVEIGNSVTSIEEYAFYDCSSLTSVEIPNSVTSIGECAFCNGEKLTIVVLGNSLTSIEKDAFKGCDNIKKIESKATKAPIIENEDQFSENVYANADLFVPIGYEDNYKYAYAWSEFHNIKGKDFSVKATSISLDKNEVSLKPTQTVVLTETIQPYDTSNKKVTWSSSDESVATIDANGLVTAIAVGEAIITATTTDGSNLSASCKVTVVPTLAVSIELDQTEANVEEKSEFQLTATILPEHTTNKEVAWSSSDKWVATVDNYGLVTMYSAGEAIITATTTDGTNLSATCYINVYSGIDGVNGNDVIVATIGENIVVKNAKLGSNVRVYATDGSIITSEIATDGDVVVKAPVKGIYIVAVDSKTFKVMVK